MTELTLDLLRNETNVFITEAEYQIILFEYNDYLKKYNLKDNEITACKFCKLWKKEQKTLGTILCTSDGAIEYYDMDADDNMTINQYLEDLDATSYHWENLCRSYWKIFHNIIDNNKVDKKLIKNILDNDETISYEQIYELKTAMINRLIDLLERK